MHASWLVLAIFFVSGVSGLLYQVVWVREFGQLFGNTLHSAALVAGVFVSGLGIGSWMGGRIADRSYARAPESGLAYYARTEVAIGVLGLLILVLLQNIGGLSAAFSSYRVGENGWHQLSAASHAFRYLVAFAVITPITLLMGATLTFLVRFLVGVDVEAAGARVGLLYGINTAGAAVGCLAVDLFLVPTFGLAWTQGIAVAGNFAAAGGAFALLARVRARGTSPVAPVPEAPVTRAGGSVGLVALALALSGFAGMAMEILWYRYFSNLIGSYRVVFSMMLFCVLVGTWLGATLGGRLSTRVRRPALFYALTQIGFVVSALGLMYAQEFSHDALLANANRAYAASGSGLGFLYELRVLGLPIAFATLIPGLWLGFAYPLANAHVQDEVGKVGARAGLLYLGNAAGALSGSLVAGFVLLPALGLAGSALVVALVSLSTAIPLVVSTLRVDATARAPALRVAALAALVALLGGIAWSSLSEDFFLLKSFRNRAGYANHLEPPALVSAVEGFTESVVVIDVPGHGKTLFTNSHPMARSTHGAQRYMRAFSHVPLLHLERPETVLVICFGVGNTTHAASLHPTISRIEVVDISANILSHAHHFADTNDNVIEDERVEIFVNDGRQHLRMRDGPPLDLVTLEPPPLQFAGVNSLYSAEFYRLARGQLRDGGFMTQWLPIRQLPEDTVRAVVAAFIDVFPESILMNGSREEYLLVGRKNARVEIDPDELVARLDRAPAVRRDLEAMDVSEVTDLLAMFAGDAATMRAGVEGYAPLSDDVPMMEYSRVWFQTSGMPGELFDVETIGSWCPRCLDADIAQRIPQLVPTLRIMGMMYMGTGSTRAQAIRAQRDRLWPGRLAPDVYRDTFRRSRYLRDLRKAGFVPSFGEQLD